MTTEELHQNFLKDLEKLVAKYDCEIHVVARDDIEVTFYEISEGENKRSKSYYQLPNYIAPYI